MQITEQTFRSKLINHLTGAAAGAIEKGKRIINSGRVTITDYNEKKGFAKFKVRGDSGIDYNTVVAGLNERDIRANCNCPYDHGVLCKHGVASIFYLLTADLSTIKKEVKEYKTIRMSNEPFELGSTDSLFDIYKENVGRFDDQFEVEDCVIGEKKITIFTSTFETYSLVNESESQVEFYIQNDKLFTTCNCNMHVKKLCPHQETALDFLTQEAGDDFFDQLYNINPMLDVAMQEYGIKDKKYFEQNFSLRLFEGNISYFPNDNKIYKKSEYLDWESNMLKPLFQREDKAKLRIGHSVLDKNTSGKDMGYAYLIRFPWDDDFFPFIIGAAEGKLAKSKDTLNAHIKPIPYLPDNDIALACLPLTKSKLKENGFYHEYYSPNTEEPDDFDQMTYFHNILEKAFPLLSGKIIYAVHDIESFRKSDLKQIHFHTEKPQLNFELNEDAYFFILDAYIKIGEKNHFMHAQNPYNIYPLLFTLDMKNYFLVPSVEQALQIEYFARNPRIKVPKKDFKHFFENILTPIARKFPVNMQIKENIQNKQLKAGKKKVFLSELDDYILFTPTIAYEGNDVEILEGGDTIFSSGKNAYIANKRDTVAESEFIDFFLNIHPSFGKRVHRDLFFLDIKEMVKDNWFIRFFDQAAEKNIDVYGLETLNNFKYNTNKAKVNISVKSGIDWFDTDISINFGDQQLTIDQVRKAVIKQEGFVKLGDGSIGILPEEWLKKLEKYFRIGQVKNKKLQISKMHFTLVDELFENIDDTTLLKEIAEKKQRLKAFEKIKKTRLPKGVNATLRPYQYAGYNWLHFLEEYGFGGCLADDMGLGKTLQVLAFLLEKKKQKKGTSLVVIPRSLIFNWQEEAKRFCPALKMYVHHGQNRDADNKKFLKHDIVLTTYGTLAGDIELFREVKFYYAILDESQAIKNPLSQRFKAVCLLQAENKLVLTGTPLENNTFDLYAQMHFVNPGLLGSREHFKKNYSDAIDKDKDEKRAAELRSMLNPFILRRTKKQVAKELPDKTENVLYCEMDKAQRDVYTAFRNKYRDYVLGKIEEDGLNKSKMYVLEGLTKLRQICNSPALLPEKEDFGNQAIKIQMLLQQIQQKSSEHKILVFSQFVKMLKLIQKELDKEKIRYAYLDGSVTKRKEAVDSFQNEEDCRLFLISLKAGGIGLNLTAADYVYVVDPWWNPAVEMQAIDRCYRIGQDKHVFAYKMICKDTVEEKILKLQEGKRKLSSDLIKTDDAFFKNLKTGDIEALFS